MEIKLLQPHLSSSPDSPKPAPDGKRDSRGMRVIHYLARTVSGNGYKDLNTQDFQSSSRERVLSRTHDISDSEDSDEDVKEPGHDGNPTDVVRPGLVQKPSDKLTKADSLHNVAAPAEEKPQQNEGAHVWVMGKSVLEVSKGVAADLRGSFSRLLQMKDMLIVKLAAVPTIPAETLDHARHSIESIVSEATQSAYGKTRDAMLRIRLKLMEILPSLSPHETKKIVDDVEQEVLDMSKAANGDSIPPEKLKDEVKDGNIGVSASTASAVMSPPAPSMLTVNMDRLKSWALFRSRL